MNTQTAIWMDLGCFGKSYPQMGHRSESASTSIAQPGHSRFSDITTTILSGFRTLKNTNFPPSIQRRMDCKKTNRIDRNTSINK
jgi:hypothetical protein